MKTLFSKIGLSVLFFSYVLNCQAGPQEELSALSRIDLLPQYRNDATIRQISSYDTTGGNDDGFSGKYSYLRKENGDLVIAKLNGPGIIQIQYCEISKNQQITSFQGNSQKKKNRRWLLL